MMINKNQTTKVILLIFIFVTGFSTTGCTTLQGPPNPDDPFESFNRSMYSFNETFDEYAMRLDSWQKVKLAHCWNTHYGKGKWG